MRQNFDSEKFLEVRELNTSQIGEALSDNASYYGFYSEQAAKWNKSVADIKLKIRVREAEIARDTRAKLGKATEGVVASEISLDDDWRRLNRELNIDREQADLYEGAVKTLQERGNNARSLNVRERFEIETSASKSYGDFEDKAEKLKLLASSARI